MSLERCTPGQLEVISTLDRPLMVSAGAGSGKTFTLTQRIVEALRAGEALSSIEQVCAITFTNAAAAELRSRIKGMLRGRGMADQARLVDGAWISTIHAMAARMLRENALRIGIDPAFEVLGSMERDMLLRQAFDQAAAEAARSGNAALRDLVLCEPLFGRGGNGRGVMDDVMDLIARARTMPAGLAGIVLPGEGQGKRELLVALRASVRALLEACDEWPDEVAKDPAFFDALAEGFTALGELSERAGGSEALSDEEFRAGFYALPHASKLRKNKGNAPFMEAYAAYRSAYAALAEEAECAMAAPRLAAVAELACMVDAAFRELKGPSRLDNDDLLRLCYEALMRDDGLAAVYRERFKLIMVDEFQDTDLLQTAIVSAIAQPGRRNVCTVGDAQQSIYRFRGADVNVFLAFKRDMFALADDARAVELPDNFRSHGDVLRLVDAIFARPSMFGDAFLHLEAKGAINSAPDALFGELPRVSVDVVHFQRKMSGPTATSADARVVAAGHIAEHFAQLHHAGAPASDMALLLGGMTHAQAYADALRAVGLESRIVAGSVFQHAPEAQMVRAALRFARDTRDGEALLQLLLSPLFAVSDDALLALASRCEEGEMRASSLAAGLAVPDAQALSELAPSDREMIGIARGALMRFAAEAQAARAGVGLRALLVESGLLDRLRGQGAEGLASAGNLEKACRLTEDLEARSCGIAELSDRFSEHLRLEKETPGLLTPTHGDHVTIMTVHGSKGLEFPHVAVAELGGKRVPEASFVAENIDGRTFVCGKARPTGDAGARADALKRLRPEREAAVLKDGMDAHEAFAALNDHRAEQEEAEAKRLLYVGLTRAVKSVYLSLKVQGDPAKGYAADPLAQGVHEALPWPVDAPDSTTMVDFGGAAPARITFAHLPLSAQMPGAADAAEAEQPGEEEPAAQAASAAEQPAEPFIVPIREAEAPAVVGGCASARSGMFSYTSLSAGMHDDGREAVPPAADAPDAAAGASSGTAPGDTRTATGAAPVGSEAVDGAATASAPQESATALGTAFHRLAQQSILRARAAATGAPVQPSAADMEAQVAACELTPAQEARLASAIGLWLSSAEAAAFFAHPRIDAEVPFSVVVGEGDGRFYLVGEIDGLASDGERAFLIDYKTGGAPDEDAAALHAKHLLQAQCYAFALLGAGFASVDAAFLRVEQPDAARPGEPQVVRYRFAAADLPELEAALAAAHAQATGA